MLNVWGNGLIAFGQKKEHDDDDEDDAESVSIEVESQPLEWNQVCNMKLTIHMNE
jgi:hypothetical protein